MSGLSQCLDYKNIKTWYRHAWFIKIKSNIKIVEKNFNKIIDHENWLLL